MQRQMDITKRIVAFCNLANAPKMQSTGKCVVAVHFLTIQHLGNNTLPVPSLSKML